LEEDTMIETNGPIADMLALRKKEADARTALLVRRASIKQERKDAAAKWDAEDKQIVEALRTREFKPRKPKGEADNGEADKAGA
jgi:hypothetical protein